MSTKRWWARPTTVMLFTVFLVLFAPLFRGESLAADPYTLTLDKTGNGTGSVSSSPSGPEYPAGTVVTLTAAPGAHSTFGGWTGCDAVIQGSGECIVTMQSDRTVSAKFTAITRTLTIKVVQGSGGGTVASDPAGPNHIEGSEVTLTPEPNANSTLRRWTGCDRTEEDRCFVTMDGARTVTVQFKLKGPIEIGPLDAASISAGQDTTCAVRVTGQGVCWGSNRDGRLGVGLPTEDDLGTVTSDTAIPVPGLEHTREISSGARNCAVLESDEVRCWGLSFGPGRWPGDYFGEDGWDRSPRLDWNPGGSTSVSAGSGPRVCAATETGVVYCWGLEPDLLNTRKQLYGDYTGSPRVSSPECVWEEGMSYRASDLDPAIVHGQEPAPVGWSPRGGHNGDGFWLPDNWGEIDCMDEVTAISSGGNHSCALRESGAVSCWGANSWGQLGNETNTYSHGDSGDGEWEWEWSAVPEYWSGAVSVSGLSDAVAVSAGAGHSCAVRESGQVVCWGRNTNGQLGDGTTLTRLAPVTVLSLSDAVDVSAGESHTCALRESGQVVCWGENSDGQLGNGTTQQQETPANVSGLNDAVAVSAGNRHTCGIRESGHAVCWGNNQSGQLGDRTNQNRSTPVGVIYTERRDGERRLEIRSNPGTGEGRVVSTSGVIDCTSSCSRMVAIGTRVELMAEPDPGSTFVGWHGCTETTEAGHCVVEIDAFDTDGKPVEEFHVTPTFDEVSNELTIETDGGGSGSVSADPEGPYGWGDEVTLTAIPDAGSTFAGFDGCEAEGSSCTVVMEGDLVVTASFEAISNELTVDTDGEGSVSVDPEGPYSWGDEVTLTATPDTGWDFTGWAGCDDSEGSSCVLTMEGDRTVTAAFDLDSSSVAVAPTKAPSITGSPASATSQTDAIFEFEKGSAETEEITGFECLLDEGQFAPCSSPKVYADLAQGGHSFAVRAVNQMGHGPTATRGWVIQQESENKPAGKPRFGPLKIQPKRRAVKRGQKTVVKVKVRNAGDGPVTQGRVCVKAPSRLVQIKNCAKLGKLAPRQTKSINFNVRVKPKAKRGRKAVLEFRAVGKNVKTMRGKAVIRIR